MVRKDKIGVGFNTSSGMRMDTDARAVQSWNQRVAWEDKHRHQTFSVREEWARAKARKRDEKLRRSVRQAAGTGTNENYDPNAPLPKSIVKRFSRFGGPHKNISSLALNGQYDLMRSPSSFSILSDVSLATIHHNQAHGSPQPPRRPEMSIRNREAKFDPRIIREKRYRETRELESNRKPTPRPPPSPLASPRSRFVRFPTPPKSPSLAASSQSQSPTAQPPKKRTKQIWVRRRKPKPSTPAFDMREPSQRGKDAAVKYWQHKKTQRPSSAPAHVSKARHNKNVSQIPGLKLSLVEPSSTLRACHDSWTNWQTSSSVFGESLGTPRKQLPPEHHAFRSTPYLSSPLGFRNRRRGPQTTSAASFRQPETWFWDRGTGKFVPPM